MMALFALWARDQPNGAALRDAHRTEHMAFMTRLDASGRVAFAGPLKDETGRSIGSLIVFEAEDEAAARAMMNEDPYAQAGVFETSEIVRTLKAFPKA